MLKNAITFLRRAHPLAWIFGHYSRNLANTPGGFVIYTLNTSSVDVKSRELRRKIFKNRLALTTSTITLPLTN